MCSLLVANLFGIATKKSSRSFTYTFKLTCVDNIQNVQFWFISKGKNAIKNKDTNEHFRVKRFCTETQSWRTLYRPFSYICIQKSCQCQVLKSLSISMFYTMSLLFQLNSHFQGQQSGILWIISYDCYDVISG